MTEHSGKHASKIEKIKYQGVMKLSVFRKYLQFKQSPENLMKYDQVNISTSYYIHLYRSTTIICHLHMLAMPAW